MSKLISLFVFVITLMGGFTLPLEYRLFLNYIAGNGDVTSSFFSSEERGMIKEACLTLDKLWEKPNSYVVTGRQHSTELTLSLGNFTCITDDTGNLVGAYDVYDFVYSNRKKKDLKGCLSKARTPKRVADCLVLNSGDKQFEINIEL